MPMVPSTVMRIVHVLLEVGEILRFNLDLTLR